MASNRNAWRRNGLPRIVAVGTALLAAAGVYGLVQANPKPGAASVAPAATSVDAPPPSSIVGTGASATSPAFGDPGNDVAPVPPQPQPQPRPHMRTRAS